MSGCFEAPPEQPPDTAAAAVAMDEQDRLLPSRQTVGWHTQAIERNNQQEGEQEGEIISHHDAQPPDKAKARGWRRESHAECPGRGIDPESQAKQAVDRTDDG